MHRILINLFISLILLLLISGCGGGPSSSDNGEAKPAEDPGVPELTEQYDASYTYDKLGRLTQITYENGQTLSYQYDSAGNIVNIAVGTE